MRRNMYAIILPTMLAVAASTMVLVTATAAVGPGASASSGATAASSTDAGYSLTKNGAGSEAGISAVFAIGEAEAAGLPAETVAMIARINGGSVAGIPAAEGYVPLARTAALVLNDSNTNTVARREVLVTLYVDSLSSGLQNVNMLLYENETGRWRVAEPIAIDYSRKIVSFRMFGSGTVTVIHRPGEPAGTRTALETADGLSLERGGAGGEPSVSAVFAVGVSETAGLPAEVVSAIASINNGDLTATGLPAVGGYQTLAKTAAIVVNDRGTNTVAEREVYVTLYVPGLTLGVHNVKLLVYENSKGRWTVIEPSAVDVGNRTIGFRIFGSATVAVIHN